MDFMTRKRWAAAPFAVLLAVAGVGCPAFGDETSFYVGDSRVTLTIPHGLVSVLTNAPNSLGRLLGRSTPADLEALDVLLTDPATSDLRMALEYPDDAVLKHCYRRWVIIQRTKDHTPVTEGEWSDLRQDIARSLPDYSDEELLESVVAARSRVDVSDVQGIHQERLQVFLDEQYALGHSQVMVANYTSAGRAANRQAVATVSMVLDDQLLFINAYSRIDDIAAADEEIDWVRFASSNIAFGLAERYPPHLRSMSISNEALERGLWGVVTGVVFGAFAMAIRLIKSKKQPKH